MQSMLIIRLFALEVAYVHTGHSFAIMSIMFNYDNLKAIGLHLV